MGWRRARGMGLLFAPQTVAVYAYPRSIKPKCSEHMAHRQKEETICQKQAGHEEREV